MVTTISGAVAAVAILIAFSGTWVFNLRAKSFELAAELQSLKRAIEDSKDSKRTAPHAPTVIAEYSDDMEIPAALVGARCKEIIEHFAPILGTTPVNLLRGALAEGLTGGKPVAEGLLEMLEEIAKEGDLPPPPSKPPVLN